MKIYLVKPDLTYYEDYNDMMREWGDPNTAAPWFLDYPAASIEEFVQFLESKYATKNKNTC